MELQIKHISPYIHLRIYPLLFKAVDGDYSLEGISGAWMVQGRKAMYVKEMPVNSIKPYLKPLSLLTREILESAGWKSHIDYMTNERQELIDRHGYSEIIESIPLRYAKWLFENHYDVFGLIDQNLAIAK